MSREKLTVEYVRSIIQYDPETGLFRWRARSLAYFKTKRACSTWNTRYVGTIAGAVRRNGYRQINICGAIYFEHRLAFLIMTGEWPPKDIDHKNLNKADNRWDNLRAATRSQNLGNMAAHRDNTSGVKGVNWSCRQNKWIARIQVKGNRVFLGGFDNIADAAEAYKKAAFQGFGGYART